MCWSESGLRPIMKNMERLKRLKHLIPALALLAAIVFAPPVHARQTNARLDVLFARLHVTDSRIEASGIEAMIWGIWTAAEDDEIDRLMVSGIAAMNAGRFAAALESFNAVIAGDTDFAEGWNKRATLYYLMGRYDESIADVERTLALEPRHFGALSGMGLIYTALEDAEAALFWFDQALEVNPHMTAIARRAEMLRKMLKGEPV